MSVRIYRPRELIHDLNVNSDLENVIRWLNQRPLASDWVAVDHIFVPSLVSVEKLREQYLTFINTLEEVVRL
jgi:hypothetical protein